MTDNPTALVPAARPDLPMTRSLDRPGRLDLDGGIARLDVSLVAGRVSVLAEPGRTGAQIEITRLKGEPIIVERDGDELRIGYHERDAGLLAKLFAASSDRKVEITVRIGADITLDLHTVSADVFAAGVHGGVDAHTVSGDLVLDGPAGDVVARSTSGAVEVRDLDGDLRAGSVSGDVTVHAERLGALRADSVSGDVTLDLADVGPAPVSVEVKNVSGSLLLRVPAEAGYRVDATTMSGVVVAGEQRVRGTGSRTLSEGDQSVHVRATSVSGDLTLLRAGAPAGGPAVLD